MKEKHIKFITSVCISFTALWLWLLIWRFIFNVPFIDSPCPSPDSQVMEQLSWINWRIDEIVQQKDYLIDSRAIEIPNKVMVDLNISHLNDNEKYKTNCHRLCMGMEYVEPCVSDCLRDNNVSDPLEDFILNK
jgi:hypothetical protein